MGFSRASITRLISCSATSTFDLISYTGICYSFIADLPQFLLTKGFCSLAAGDSKPTKSKSLSSLFTNPSTSPLSFFYPDNAKSKKTREVENKQPQFSHSSHFNPMQERNFPKELSSEEALFLKRLQEELYPNVVLGRIHANSSSHQLLKSAAEKLGQRHQEIAKWLSGSALKKIALFGCPSTEGKTVFASKRLRSFFCIQEDAICHGCKLKASCKFVNQRVGRVERVILADVLRLLTVLAFDALPPQLQVTDEVKLSAGKLMREAVNLSEDGI